MPITIRRLTTGDEALLEFLALHDAEFDTEFDLDQPGKAQEPLSPARAKAYLENPTVLHWVALEGQTLVGSLLCYVLPLDSGPCDELLLYDIGVHYQWRRHGVGRALLSEMEQWMRRGQIDQVWVLAGNKAAVEFYRACDFTTDPQQPLYLWRDLSGSSA